MVLNMFRTNNTSEMSDTKFGVGSEIRGERNENWLVVREKNGNVRLVNLTTFEIEEGFVQVVDYNHMTRDEAGNIAQLNRLPYTRSDFSYIAKGFKGYDPQ